ncbi:unnamed protein product [Urochloa humidicola]
MLPVQEALDLVDFAAASSSCVPRDLGMDIITCGFTPWGPDTCPSLDQVMASAAASRAPAPEAAEVGEHAEAAVVEEEEERRRRQRRKESNRLSARRSRERKQQRLEELRGAAAVLRAERQALESWLHDAARRGAAVCRHNARLRAEAAALARRLREARRLLALRRLALLPPPPQPATMMMTPLLQQQAAGVAPPLGLASLMT